MEYLKIAPEKIKADCSYRQKTKKQYPGLFPGIAHQAGAGKNYIYETEQPASKNCSLPLSARYKEILIANLSCQMKLLARFITPDYS
ncbi:hypothetical protein [Klebsiella sp. BIGb0407]|uniref:hypothetical protein n=1 Tax=Klebsiella sp. BIGb0407 TaxID=2940603 RepID=UPI002167B010|nr:hypothetical protein [Klebsiella sp. BIGb0407]MCS3430545.1 hypothetical protein [Klebsiella sp. BIGb0407]